MEEVEARLVTDLPDMYRIPASTYSLPTDITPAGLQQLVSQQTGQAQPLIFTLNNTLLTTSLHDHMVALSLSPESLLEIWYSLALPMPSTTASIPSPDWISACEFLPNGQVIATDYAGNITLTTHQNVVFSETVHPYPIKAMAVTKERGGLVATGGKDGTIKITVFNEDEIELKAEGKVSSIESIAWNPSGSMLASGQFNGQIHISTINFDETAMITKASKRQKLHGFSLHSQRINIPHTDCVTGVRWPELDVVYTASMDHSAVAWDVSRETAVFTYTAPRGIQSFDVMGKLVACGLENGVIKVVDERSHQTVSTLTSSSWVRCLQWHNNCLLTGSESGELNIWDIRATSALSTEQKHTDKLLALSANEDWVVTGGADCCLQFHRFKGD